MKVIYAVDFIPDDLENPIFLVGPTPRIKIATSWRPQALHVLDVLGFQGTVITPEPESGLFPKNFLDQVDWEDEALTLCSKKGCIAAWVPRELQKMPAFTTNVEFGMYLNCGRFVYGRPDNAPKTRYLDFMYKKKVNREPCNQLTELIAQAICISKNEPIL